MHQFVQSAIEAAKQGDKNKAIEFLKQVLNANPNDVDAWLVLAAVMDDPQRKRQCLRRVLTLDPVNMMAREELDEMDRAEMGDSASPFTSDSFGQNQDEPAPVSLPLYQPKPSSAFYSTGTSAFEPEETPPPPPAQTKPQTQSSAKAPAKKTKDKPLVFKYPLFWRIFMYFFVVVLGCGGLLLATQSLLAGLFFFGLGLIMLVVAFALSPTVEISTTGIRASGMFSSTESDWDEIVKMKSSAMKRRLELTKRNGEVVKVSTQVSGYPRIVEIVRKKRPDLFGIASTSSIQSSTSAFEGSSSLSTGYSSTGSTPSFTGTKLFKKGMFAQYGVILLMIPLCMVGAWFTIMNDDKFAGIGISLVGLLFMAISLFSINQVKLEPNKLTTETFFGEKEYTAREIKEIAMKTVRGRYGAATNFVNIKPVKGGDISMAGFPEGDEIIYGALINWWETYKNI